VISGVTILKRAKARLYLGFWVIVLAVGLGFWVRMGTIANAATIKLIANENSPFSIKNSDNKLAGFPGELTQDMLKLAGIDFQVSFLPRARVLMTTRDQPMTCAIAVSRTAEREGWFRWVMPLVQKHWTLFARADFDGTPKSLEDLHPYTIGTSVGDAVTEFLLSHGLKVEPVSVDSQNAAKLHAGRIDLWATGESTGPILASQAGIADLKPVFVVLKTMTYLACNKSLDDKIAGAMLGAMEQLRTNGTVEQLRAKYLIDKTLLP
jgi:polar amino acid transport system substrate-binding protein